MAREFTPGEQAEIAFILIFLLVAYICLEQSKHAKSSRERVLCWVFMIAFIIFAILLAIDVADPSHTMLKPKTDTIGSQPTAILRIR